MRRARFALSLLAALLLAACAPAPAAPSRPPSSAAAPDPSGPAVSPPSIGGSGGAPAAAPAPAERPPLRPITFAYPSVNPNLLPVRLAIREGAFEAEGLDARMMHVASSAYAPAMLNGEVEYSTAFGATVRLAATGAPLKVVMVLSNRPLFYLISQPDVASVLDLRGKPVGTGPRGGSLEQTAKDVFSHYGLDPRTDLATLPSQDTSAIISALLAGQVQGAVVTLPFNLVAETQGMKTLVDAGDLFRAASGGVVVTDQRLQERPDEVRAVIRAALRGLELTRTHRDAAIAETVEFAGIAPELAERAYEAVVKATTTDGLATDAEIQPEIDNAKAAMGTPDATIPISQVVDFRLLRAVLAEQRR
jgi:NitT/TauT family transport system substrate-binding protein